MEAIVEDEYGSPGVKYRRVVVTRHGGPGVLQVVEEDLPEPGAGEVRVKVLAAGVYAYDLMHRPNQGDLVVVKELLEAGEAGPVIDRCYPLHEVAEALRYHEGRRAREKVVITM